MKNQMHIFGKTIFAAKKMRYVEVFALLSEGPCSRGNCMIPKKSTLPDAQLLFNMTQHTMNNTHDQNEIFFDIMQDLQDCSTGFETGVDIPVDHQGE